MDEELDFADCEVSLDVTDVRVVSEPLAGGSQP